MRKFALREHPENKLKNYIGNEKNIPTKKETTTKRAWFHEENEN